MTQDEVLAQINSIFCDVVDRDDIKLTRETTARDVEDWDSLNHIQFVVAIEKAFKVRFKSNEINSWENVGDMCDAVGLKILEMK